MDSDKEYVEVFDDEGGARDKTGRPAQLRRYKDAAYRSAAHICALHASCQSVQLQNSISTCTVRCVSLIHITKHAESQKYYARFAMWDQ